MANQYATKVFKPSLHKKYYLSDYRAAESRYLGRLALVAGLALIVIAFGAVAYIDGQQIAIAIEMEAR